MLEYLLTLWVAKAAVRHLTELLAGQAVFEYCLRTACNHPQAVCYMAVCHVAGLVRYAGKLPVLTKFVRCEIPGLAIYEDLDDQNKYPND